MKENLKEVIRELVLWPIAAMIFFTVVYYIVKILVTFYSSGTPAY